MYVCMYVCIYNDKTTTALKKINTIAMQN